MRIDLKELVAVYGRVPSFHDARLQEVSIDGDIDLRIYVYEPFFTPSGEPDGEDVHTLVTLRFHHPHEMCLWFVTNSAYRAIFSESGPVARFEWIDEESGETGFIEAESITVLSLVEAKPSEVPFESPYERFTVRFINRR